MTTTMMTCRSYRHALPTSSNSFPLPNMNIAIFASGNGTNCENIIRHLAGKDTARVCLVISNKADAYVLTRARNLGVKTTILSRNDINNADIMLPLLHENAVDYIVLAGFMLMIPPFLVKAYARHIINIHPSLLPKYGGKGMYGRHVHEAVKASGDDLSGITIHYVSDIYDGGEIIAQFATHIAPEDTVEDIERKVRMLETKHFPQVIESVIRNGKA